MLVSAVMTVVNVITDYRLLMWSTLVFAVLGVINIAVSLINDKCAEVIRYIFQVEIILLFTFFIVTGEPQGFAAIWAAMVPPFSLLLYNRKHGTILSAIMFLVLIFFFWIPAGHELLMYDYTESFMLRFPLFYIAFYVVSFIFETGMVMIYENFIHLKDHDPLTDALNRRGFAVHIENFLAEEFEKAEDEARETVEIGFAIMDLDLFKMVNDTYGHFTGDEVLCESARRITEVSGLPACRWGGEEFAIIGPREKMGFEQMDKIRRAFDSSPVVCETCSIDQRVSIGVALFSLEEPMNSDAMCIEADKLLYIAKESGRNRVVCEEIGKHKLQ